MAVEACGVACSVWPTARVWVWMRWALSGAYVGVRPVASGPWVRVACRPSGRAEGRGLPGTSVGVGPAGGGIQPQAGVRTGAVGSPVSLRRPRSSSRMFSPFRSQLPEQSKDFLLLQPWVAEVVQRSVDVLQQVALGH